MSDIFLSYASEDRDRVRPLVEALEERGWSVWWDREIPVGMTWPQMIEAALESCRVTVVVWTRASVASEWVQIEASESRKHGRLVPVRMDDVEPPLEFRRVQAAELIDSDGRSNAPGLNALVSRLEEVLGSTPPSVPASRTVPDTPRSEAADSDAPASALPPSPRLVTRSRALALGSFFAVLSFVSLAVWSGFERPEGSRSIPDLSVTAAASVDDVLLMAREAFFSDSYEDGTLLISRLLARPDMPRDARLRALRYQARASIEAGELAGARAAVSAMLDLEPPLVVLHVAVESPELMELYRSARRLRETSRSDVIADSAWFSVGPFAVTNDGSVRGWGSTEDAALGVGISQMVVAEVMASGLRMVSRERSLIAGADPDPEAYYAFYESLFADQLGPLRKETHMITGSIGIRNGRVLVTVWATEMATANVVARGQAEGAAVGLYELIQGAARALMASPALDSTGSTPGG